MADQLAGDQLEELFVALASEGYRIIGPTIREGAIVYDELRSASELPVGWTDEQGPGHYRLKPRDDQAAFGYVVGPHSWKQYLFPPHEPLVRIRSKGDLPEWRPHEDEGPPLAFLGVRGCELAAIDVQDRVFVRGPFVDGRYRARRDRCLLIAVSCTEAGDLCFCASMGTGPRAEGDYDLRLTELGETFLVEARSARGQAILGRLPTEAAEEPLLTEADEAIERCRASMGRHLDTEGLPARLMGNLDHPRWDDVAERCLACANCTLVCPTCFCFDIHDGSSLMAPEADRERSWDSCFTAAHSTIHGAQFRPDTRSRYQQWMTHKLATWVSQFGTSGCVGCGRCIAWCPVGIDLTEEATVIGSGEGAPMPLPAPRRYPPREDDGLVPVPVRVLAVERETHDTVTLHLERPAGYAFEPGQFNMLSLPGVGDVPISVSGASEDTIEHTLRGVGAATRALAERSVGDVVGVRGPFGSAWPLEAAVGRPVGVIAGGIGLAPLRSALRAMLARPGDFPSLRLMYGTRSPAEILYDRELLGWISSSDMRTHVTVDRGDRTWAGNIGVVTKLMRRKRLSTEGIYFICGPEIMMRFTLQELTAIGVPSEQIHLSMERNMKCAVGLCGRCQYGPHFVCKDGPVFRHDQIADIFGQPGF